MLSHATKLNNANVLQEIGVLFLSIYDRIENENQLRKKIVRLNQLCEQAFEQHKVDLIAYPELLNSFQHLIDDDLFELDEGNFKVQLKTWINNYQTRERNDRDKLTRLHLTAEMGITQSLVQAVNGVVNSPDPYKVWGDEFDIRLILKNLITDPQNISKSGTYVLPTVPLVLGPHASPEEAKLFSNQLQTVIENNPKQKKDISLLIPVNWGQGHWGVVAVTINNGKITHADLYDSQRNTKLAQSAAYQNMVNVVNALNKDESATFRPIATGVQRGNAQCSDYTVQQIVRLLDPSTVGAAGLTEVNQASSAEELRQAMIDTAIRHHQTLHNHPGLKNIRRERHQPVRREETAHQKPIRKAREINTNLDLSKITDENVKQDIQRIFKHETLTNPVKDDLQNTLHRYGTSAQTRNVQIDFDSRLAEIYQDLLNDKSNKKISSDVLFNTALTDTYLSYRRQFSFFKPRDDRKRETDNSFEMERFPLKKSFKNG